MIKKINSSIPWFAILAIVLMVSFGLGIILKETMAGTVEPSVTVGNQSPTVGAIILNGGSDITLNENTTVTVTGTTTVSDSNEYADIVSVTSTLFLNNTSTCNDGVQNANWCYSSWVSCATSSCSGDSCQVSCSADVWFIAEASDAVSSYPGDAWQMNITVVDSADGSDTNSTSEDLITLPAGDTGAAINYGTVNPGATSSEISLNATNTGNCVLDFEIDGEDMAGPGVHTIAVGQQEYSTSSSYSSGAWTALSATPTTLSINMTKPTATTSNSTDNIYWIIEIPDPQYPGAYTGTTTMAPVQG